MKPQVVSLRVLAAYARDVGRGVVRLDGRSMEVLGVTDGDVVEIIGKKDGTDARCYRLLPSDEDQGIARIDPALRKMIGVAIDHTVTIRKIAADTVASAATPATTEQEEAGRSMSPSQEKERPKIMHFIATLESAARSQSKCKCYSDGKKALGWDFFLLELDENFVDKLRDLYPDIQKQEAGSMEEQFALWMNKQLKRMANTDFHLKLSDVPQEKTKGFRLNPEHFRDKTSLEDLR
jgi:hypothetical protein